jgi:hypothetical protein
MRTVCVIRTLQDERELVVVEVPDAPPTFAVLSAPVDDPSMDADVRVVAHGLKDADRAHRAAIEHARDVADIELERAGLGLTIDLRYGDNQWRAAMGLPRHGASDDGHSPFQADRDEPDPCTAQEPAEG